jgi:uncharacterized UPF0146 family protein
MGSYKHIEQAAGTYIAAHYSRAIEAGIGTNTVAAELLAESGALLRCTDVRDVALPAHLGFSKDDIFEPDLSLYAGADVLYAIRPAIEMIPPLVAIARAINCDLLVCHLGFELYGNGGERIALNGGVTIHRYVQRSEPVKEG